MPQEKCFLFFFLLLFLFEHFVRPYINTYFHGSCTAAIYFYFHRIKNAKFYTYDTIAHVYSDKKQPDNIDRSSLGNVNVHLSIQAHSDSSPNVLHSFFSIVFYLFVKLKVEIILDSERNIRYRSVTSNTF